MRRLLIVADAGGTKTSWYVLPEGIDKPLMVKTSGINATIHPFSHIVESVKELFYNLEDILNKEDFFIQVSFYGAGANSENAFRLIERAFSEVFSTMKVSLDIDSDLTGAARALYGSESGIACIIGTGSATGLYDGERIVEKVPSLGFILGDEGSGAYMGRQLVNRFFKSELEKEVEALLEDFCDMSQSNILQKVYREKGANSFLASFVPFIHRHRDFDSISDIIYESLKLFFEKNVLKYINRYNNRIRFVGGVAYLFASQLSDIAENYGFVADRFIPDPIRELGEYHKNLG